MTGMKIVRMELMMMNSLKMMMMMRRLIQSMLINDNNSADELPSLCSTDRTCIINFFQGRKYQLM